MSTTAGRHAQDQNDIWVPRLGHPNDPKHPFNKQWDVFNSRKRIQLVSGSRKSGKTHSVLHRVVRHGWETPGARIAVFAKSKGLAKDGGSWQALNERIIPEWIASGIVNKIDLPFDYTTHDAEGRPGPKQDSITRAPFFKIRNYHGGESEYRLFSIEHDQEVEEKVRNKEFSMIYFIELSMFKDRRILTVTLPSLRMPHLRPQPGQPDQYHQWIADTNPDVDLGDKSWFYDEWYRRRTMDFRNSEVKRERDNADKLARYYANFGLIEMFTKENPYITEDETIELEASCEGDQSLYDSYVDGVHGSAGRNKVQFFTGFFSKPVHVIGGGPDESDHIAIAPSTVELFTGWDIGDSVNHAAAIMQQRIIDEVSYWDVLDEEVVIKEAVGTTEFTLNLLAKLDALQTEAKRTFKLRNWADSTAINVFRASSESYDCLEVSAASQGRIILDGVEKPSGSVKARVQLLRKLLRQNRFFVSARCERTIHMLQELKRGDVKTEFVARTEDAHIFDAISYCLFMELRVEMMNESRKRPTAASTDLAIVGIG